MMKINTKVHLLNDSEGLATLAVFRGIITWCRGTLLKVEEVSVSILVSDDLGVIERDGRHYDAVVFVYDNDKIKHSSGTLVSTVATLEINVYCAVNP